jgi:hypothetical protein
MPGILGFYDVATQILNPYAVVTNPKVSQTVNQPAGVALDFYDTAVGKTTLSIANGGTVSGTPGFSVLSGFTINTGANNLQIDGYTILITGLALGDVLEFDGTHWVNSSTASAGVTSLNGLSGALTLVAGAGITVTPSGHDITIAATGGSAPPIVASANQIAMTGSGGTVLTYTPPSDVGMYRISFEWDAVQTSGGAVEFDIAFQDALGNAASLAFTTDGLSANGSDIVYDGQIEFETDNSGTDIVLTVPDVGNVMTGLLSATLEQLFLDIVH